jgi:hypothetical protein
MKFSTPEACSILKQVSQNTLACALVVSLEAAVVTVIAAELELAFIMKLQWVLSRAPGG